MTTVRQNGINFNAAAARRRSLSAGHTRQGQTRRETWTQSRESHGSTADRAEIVWLPKLVCAGPLPRSVRGSGPACVSFFDQPLHRVTPPPRETSNRLTTTAPRQASPGFVRRVPRRAELRTKLSTFVRTKTGFFSEGGLRRRRARVRLRLPDLEVATSPAASGLHGCGLVSPLIEPPVTAPAREIIVRSDEEITTCGLLALRKCAAPSAAAGAAADFSGAGGPKLEHDSGRGA